MKKYILTLVAVLVVSSFAYAALTESSDDGSAADGSWFKVAPSGKVTFPGSTTNGPLIQFTPSANVSMAYDCNDGTIYSFGTYHSSGTKLYSTSSTDAKIFMYDLGGAPGDVNAPSVTIPTVEGTAPALTVTYGSGWSALK